MPTTPTTTTFSNGGKKVSAQLFTPVGTGNGGAIIIAYGSDGMLTPWDTMIQGYADSLTQKGFVALVPDYLGATATTPGPGVFTVISKFRDDWQGVISATIDHAQTLPGVDAANLGLLGFSLGGHLCLRLRARVKILVEFFAPIFDGIGNPGTLTHAQIHHGEEDKVPATGFENAPAIAGVLKREGTPTDLFGYPNAGHGFITKFGGTDAGNHDALTKSQERTLQFFEERLANSVSV